MSLLEDESLISPPHLDENGRPTISRQNAIRRRPVRPLGVVPNDKTVVFFDNDIENIRNMTVLTMAERFFQSSAKPKIHGILINEKTINPLYGEQPVDTDYSYLPVWKNNTYAEHIRKNHGEHYPPDEGVNEGHLEMLRVWLSTDPEKKIVIFDWDRTLAVTEGVSIPRGTNSYEDGGIKSEDVIEYLMGGAERLALLREFFDYCNKWKVTILVITNNGSAVGSSRENFLKLVQMVIPQMDDTRLLASRDNTGGKYESYTNYVKSISKPSMGRGGNRRTRRIRKRRPETRIRGAHRFGRTRRIQR